MTNRPATIAMMCESDARGGAEMVVLRLALALHERGHTLVGVGPDEATQPNRGSNGWLRDQFDEHGFAWRTYRKRRPIDLLLVRDLTRTLRDLDVDVVHSHEFGMAVYGAAAAKRLGLSHVISMHANRSMTGRWTRRVALRWAFSKSRATVAVSDQTREHLEETLGLAPGYLTVITNGVPDAPGSRERGRSALGLRDEDLFVLAVGTLSQRKGHRLLIEALQGLGSDLAGARWRLGIAGTGKEHEALGMYVATQGLQERVRLLGGRDDVPDLLAACDVFAMPSFWEGLPLALLEAMFAGRAIVASAVSGIPEAARDEREALLVPPGDVKALSGALGRYLADEDLRERLGCAARVRALEMFSMNAMTNAYERLYFGDP